MYEIIKVERLSSVVMRMEILAPLAARRARPGHFVILRVNDGGERIPLTIGGYDCERGTVSVMFQVAGASTEKLAHKKQGEYLSDFAGPLGKPTQIEGLKKAAVIGGGVGCAVAYPVAKALHDQGTLTHVVVGFRDESRLMLLEEFERASDQLIVLTDDGSAGRHGMVTDALGELLASGEKYNEIIAIGPPVMMRAVAEITKPLGIRTTASMNPIMIDGTGMCGCCRLTVGEELRFACVDGPDFDAHAVDFDEMLARMGVYREFEQAAHEHVCNLLQRGEAV